ncbi:MAG TPA: BON domain-containing protein [Candidatus Acidoferrales bacterium]|nr:BON domain-containing protein [Candidatus Acidoferrales bacterium]
MRRIKEVSLRSSAILFFSFLLIFGLSSSTSAAPSARVQPVAPGSSNYEAWLTKEVRHQLVMLPFYSVFDNLQYKIEGSKVTLIGQVVRPVLKDDAGYAVKHIEGVESVDNQIEVLPVSPNDNRLRLAVYRSIYSFPSLQLYQVRSVPPIHIIVDNGHLTLEGSVATKADKDVAGIRANTVPGIFSVTNNLRVDNGK